MAIRPIFLTKSNSELIIKEDFEFQYFNGFAEIQKKRCIESLHKEFNLKYPESKVLEISSKSEQVLGVELSAFNLSIVTKDERSFSVETAFQASKVFENGGPYVDLYGKPSIVAKKDQRLKTSGRVIGFNYFGKAFDIFPKTLFYNWLYINALYLHPELKNEVLNYDAFTDIMFNPQKSINCQAEAVAIFVALSRSNQIEYALKNIDNFKNVVYPNFKQPQEKDKFEQLDLL